MYLVDITDPRTLSPVSNRWALYSGNGVLMEERELSPLDAEAFAAARGARIVGMATVTEANRRFKVRQSQIVAMMGRGPMVR